MSSSRIYPKTTNFQPENILQDGSSEKPGWNSDVMVDRRRSEYQNDPLYKENSNKERAFTSDQDQRQNLAKETSSKQQKLDETTPKLDDELFGDILAKPEQVAPKKTSPPPPPPEPAPVPVVDEEAIQLRIEESYQKGLADGLNRAEEDFKTATATLVTISEQLNTTRELILQNSMGEMQDLVITIAEKIIRHSITAQDDTIVQTVEDCIRQAVKSDEFYVCINQDDYDIINAKSPDLISRISGLDNIVIKIDNNIEPGGCKIESDFCTVDATIASQLQIITDQVKSRR